VLVKEHLLIFPKKIDTMFIDKSQMLLKKSITLAVAKIYNKVVSFSCFF